MIVSDSTATELLLACPRCGGAFTRSKLPSHLVEFELIGASEAYRLASEAVEWGSESPPVSVRSEETPVPPPPDSAVGKDRGQPTALPELSRPALTRIAGALRTANEQKKKRTTLMAECSYCHKIGGGHTPGCKRKDCKLCVKSGGKCTYHRNHPRQQAKSANGAVSPARTPVHQELLEAREELLADIKAAQTTIADLEAEVRAIDRLIERHKGKK